MKSKSLTKNLKSDIIRKAIYNACYERRISLKEIQPKIFEKLYGKMFSRVERDLMVSLPVGWIDENNNSIDIKVNPVDFCKKEYRFYPVKEFRWPRKNSCSHMREMSIDHSMIAGLRSEILDYIKESDSIDTLHTSIASEVGKVLAQCRTTKQLLNLWPECKEFLPNYLLQEQPKPEKCLPIKCDVSGLNKLLGIK